MSDTTRRGFVKNSMTAAAGMTVVGALAAETAQARTRPHHSPVVAYVRDAGNGEISVMAGQHTFHVRDRQLAARIAQAASHTGHAGR
jgi:hypothetical protein